MVKLAPLEPGIYFDLPEEHYHADKALSRSDIVNLLDTPNTYWLQSWMNPERKRRAASDAMDYGTAFHSLLFEPHLFEKKYQVVPIDAWDSSKKMISHDDYFKIVESIKVLRAGADSSLFLSGGKPEVTVVFDYMGQRFRTRHDYFMPVLSSDFKTSWTLNEHHIKKEFGIRGLDVQLALYKQSRQRFKEQFYLGEAHAYGNVDEKFLNKFLNAEMNEFMFIFQRSTAPFPYLPLMPEEDTEYSGANKIIKAMQIHEKYQQEYGHKPWPVCEGKVKAFSMFHGIKEQN